MYKSNFLHCLTKWIIDFMFYSGIIVSALIPLLMSRFAPHYRELTSVFYQMMAVLLVSGLASVYILWVLRCIFKTLVNSNPFTMNNVTALRKMAMASFVIAITYMAKCVFWFTLATVIIVIIFAIAGLFCLVLADVFKQAVVYKEENELTV